MQNTSISLTQYSNDTYVYTICYVFVCSLACELSYVMRFQSKNRSDKINTSPGLFLCRFSIYPPSLIYSRSSSTFRTPNRLKYRSSILNILLIVITSNRYFFWANANSINVLTEFNYFKSMWMDIESTHTQLYR